MSDYGVTKEEAMSKFMEMASDAWKDANKESLRPSSYKSRDVLTRVVNFARLTDVTYKTEDGYTHPEKVLKPFIVAMLIDPFQL